MDRDTARTRILHFALALLLLLPILATVKGVLLEPLRASGLWEGYDTYLVEDTGSITPEQVAEILREAGYPNVIHSRNQRVRIFSYDGLESYPLHKLDTKYVRRDPLIDPYIAALDGYFHASIAGEAAYVLYAEEASLSLRAHLSLQRRLDRLPVDWTRSGGSGWANLVLASLAGLFLLAVAVTIARRFTLIFLLSVLPYALGLLALDYYYTVSVLLASLGTAFLLRLGLPAVRRYLNSPGDVRPGMLIRPLALYLLACTLALLYPLLGPAPAGLELHLLIGMILQGCVAALYLLREMRRYLRQQHRLFYPISLERRHPRGNTLLPPVAWGALLLLFLCLPFGTALIEGSGAAIRLPVPHSGAERTQAPDETNRVLSFEDLYRIAREQGLVGSDDTGRLPGLKEYVAHRAYQEGYFYGRSYGFPRPGEEISIPVYAGGGTAIETEEKRVKLFTDAWYGDIIAQARQRGIERLLYAQGMPVEVNRAAADTLGITGTTTRGHTVVTVLMSLFIFIAVNWNLHASRSQPGRQMLRERRKVA